MAEKNPKGHWGGPSASNTSPPLIPSQCDSFWLRLSQYPHWNLSILAQVALKGDQTMSRRADPDPTMKTNHGGTCTSRDKQVSEHQLLEQGGGREGLLQSISLAATGWNRILDKMGHFAWSSRGLLSLLVIRAKKGNSLFKDSIPHGTGYQDIQMGESYCLQPLLMGLLRTL